jgi:antitoxin (DNA-binding transcriptional repressor) of toxin-antitoxin stability system
MAGFMGIEEARMPLGDLVLDALRDGTITTLTRYGSPAAAIVPLGRIARAEPMTYRAAVDNITGDAWRLTVCETDITGYLDDEPQYEWSGREVLTWNTDIPASGDAEQAIGEAHEVLRRTGWERSGEWEAASEGYYADVTRATT